MSKYILFNGPGEGIYRDARDFEIPRPSLLARLIPRAIPITWVSGLDISRYQTDDIAKAFPALKAAGWQLLFIQATFGSTGVDFKFDRFWQAALDAGLWPIPYHFFYANYDGYIQADHFLRITDTMRNATGIQAGMVDVEARDGATIATRFIRLNQWWSGFRSHGKVVTYSSPNLWSELTGGARLNAADTGMVAHWTSANAPAIPVGWTVAQTKFWQRGVYTKHAHIEQPPGVSEDVDVDSWMGTMDELRVFLGVPVPTPPPPVPPDLAARVTALEDRVVRLAQTDENQNQTLGVILSTLKDYDVRLDKLEREPDPPLVYALFKMNERKPASCIKGQNAVGKPMFQIYPRDGSTTSERIFLDGTIKVSPTLILGDSSAKMYPVYMSAPVQLYVHTDDGALVT